MRFKSIVLTVLIGVTLVVAAILIHYQRPAVETTQPTAARVRATGKCASCHREETGAIVAQFEHSAHAGNGVTCLDCHAVQTGQEALEHRGFTISTAVTPTNCAQCHATQYRQFLQSRHAAPAYAAVLGPDGFTPEQIAFSEQFNPGAVNRPANALTGLEGEAATAAGCVSCHSIGEPHADGSIGNCTACHARHSTSVTLARLPETCGQCHMGPDHSQLEIYTESKHGVLFNAQREQLDLGADPERLTVEDMPIPTCATCHMSGLGGLAVTHDPGERLSWYLFADISEPRPNYVRGQLQMKEVCLNCHASTQIDNFYQQAEEVLRATNEKVAEVTAIMGRLRSQGLLTPAPFDEPIEFAAFDYWHYYGRTTKHGAFMGGADFVQWHGNYELLRTGNEIRNMARELEGGPE